LLAFDNSLTKAHTGSSPLKGSEPKSIRTSGILGIQIIAATSLSVV
jgi:hypothetical protein